MNFTCKKGCGINRKGQIVSVQTKRKVDRYDDGNGSGPAPPGRQVVVYSGRAVRRTPSGFHRPYGAQAQILLALLDRGGQGALLTQLHQAFGYSIPTLSCMVKRLREKGYIRAEHCCEDDRRRLLFATEAARQLRPELERIIGAVHRQLYDGFSPEDLDTLDRLQQKLLRNLSPLMEETQKEESKS